MTNRIGGRILSLRSYDANSGLVFNERVIPAVALRACLLCRPPLPGRVHHEADQTTTSLKDMALRALSAVSTSLTSYELCRLPDRLLKEVWDVLRSCNPRPSFQLWLAFANACANDSHFRHEFVCRCTHPDLSAVQSAQHDLMSWTTRLELRHTRLQIDDYMRLTELRNVEYISLRDVAMGWERVVRNHFDDRLLRAWSEAANSLGAFPRLKSLFIEAQPISSLAFGFLNKFPKLELLGLFDISWTSEKSSKAIAEGEGWRCLQTPEFISEHLKGDARMWRPDYRGLFSMIRGHHDGLGQSLTHDVSLLQLRLDDCEKEMGQRRGGKKSLQWYQRDQPHTADRAQDMTNRDASKGGQKSVPRKRKACDLGELLNAF